MRSNNPASPSKSILEQDNSYFGQLDNLEPGNLGEALFSTTANVPLSSDSLDTS